MAARLTSKSGVTNTNLLAFTHTPPLICKAAGSVGLGSSVRFQPRRCRPCSQGPTSNVRQGFPIPGIGVAVRLAGGGVRTVQHLERRGVRQVFEVCSTVGCRDCRDCRLRSQAPAVPGHRSSCTACSNTKNTGSCRPVLGIIRIIVYYFNTRI